MSCLGYNCRGLGNHLTVRELRNVVKREVPTLLFVMETKIGGKRVEKLANSLGFGGSFAVDSDGLSGGIGLFWRTDVVVELKSFNLNHIDVLVKAVGDDERPWRFTGFYGEPRKENRHLSWTLLKRLAHSLNYPWLCVGDFNETMFASEHFSITERPDSQMRAFRECLEDCNLSDLGWTGLPFTWDNRQPVGSNVRARLDRGFGNDALHEDFLMSKAQHLSMVESDHCAILIRLKRRDQSSGSKTKRVFRYENVWQTHTEYDQTVEKLWAENVVGGGLKGVMSTLQNMQKGLDKWGDKTFGNFKNKLSTLRKDLDRLRLSSMGRGPSKEERDVMAEINKVLAQEEIWKSGLSSGPEFNG